MTTPALAQIGPSGQFTIPVSIRRQLGIDSGGPVRLTVVDGQLVIRPVVVFDRATPEQVEKAMAEVLAEHSELVAALQDRP
jgi:AbrB family looped-hinge helix DNA binding protein